MEFLKFDPTAAVAWIISAHLVLNSILTLLFLWKDFHNTVCGLALTDRVGHDRHGFICMIEESLVTLAQVIQPCFSIGRFDEIVARFTGLWYFRPSSPSHTQVLIS